MECQATDSKHLYKVFDGSKRKRTRKKELDDTNSVATDDSNSGCQVNPGRIASGKTSLQDLPTAQAIDVMPDGDANRKRGSSPSISRSPHEGYRAARSPRRHRRTTREGLSLALKAGMVSTPRSITPTQADGGTEAAPPDQDSLIYAFLEEAIKRDKKKHSRRHEERRNSRERDRSGTREHRHKHRRRHDVSSKDREQRVKEKSPSPAIDQTIILETFAKICAQMNEKTKQNSKSNVPRTQSHKSLQCEVASRRDVYEERIAVRQRSHDRSREVGTPSRIRSQENFQPQRTTEKARQDCCCYEKEGHKYTSKMDVNRRRHEDDRYHEYPPETVPTRTFINSYGDRPSDYRDYDGERRYTEDKRRLCEQKTSRSFDVHRESYDYDKCKRSARSDTKDKRYDDKYYEKHRDTIDRHFASKEHSRRNLERCDRNSVVSREDEFRERDRYSERERDSGLSVADGETSTVSGRSNYLRVVKQEISEQREAMDKMMKLWKELMRCFKGVSQTQVKDKAMNESVDNVRESAAAQLRLWRECMRRYETVARDVGDTDARLMEEINKQRSEMAEMSGMWQECLQRYRDMSNDFNTLKQKLVAPESPTRLPAPPLVCAEGEGSLPSPQYRVPSNYPPMAPPLSGGYPGGSALRGRASAPPAWWWGAGQDSPRRRSSQDSRGSRDRDSRHRHKDTRDEPRYKGKSSKPSAARSEHRHRKR